MVMSAPADQEVIPAAGGGRRGSLVSQSGHVQMCLTNKSKTNYWQQAVIFSLECRDCLRK